MSAPPTLTVVATWYNHPELLELHRESWRRAWPDEIIEYIAYIDAKDPATREELVSRCEAAGIRFVLVPAALHLRREILFPATPARATHASSFRNAVVCQYAWLRQTSAEHKRTARLIFTQSDIFPFKSTTWAAWMEGAALSYRPQHRMSQDGARRLDYAWEGLCGFDLDKWSEKMIAAMSFEAGSFRGIFGDTGAGSWLLLSALPAELKRGWRERDSGSWTPATAGALPQWLQRFLAVDPRGGGAEGPAYGEIFDDWCFHLRGGSDYEKADARMLQLRFALFQALLYEALLKESSDQTGANTGNSHRA